MDARLPRPDLAASSGARNIRGWRGTASGAPRPTQRTNDPERVPDGQHRADHGIPAGRFNDPQRRSGSRNGNAPRTARALAEEQRFLARCNPFLGGTRGCDSRDHQVPTPLRPVGHARAWRLSGPARRSDWRLHDCVFNSPWPGARSDRARDGKLAEFLVGADRLRPAENAPAGHPYRTPADTLARTLRSHFPQARLLLRARDEDARHRQCQFPPDAWRGARSDRSICQRQEHAVPPDCRDCRTVGRRNQARRLRTPPLEPGTAGPLCRLPAAGRGAVFRLHSRQHLTHGQGGRRRSRSGGDAGARPRDDPAASARLRDADR